MVIEKVVSGGQTGVDRAALDVALRLGVPCGGWCPQGRLAEDGPLPLSYPLDETPSPEYAERTLWNVRDTDGTLVLTSGPPADGTGFTVQCARSLAKPCLIVDFEEGGDPAHVLAWAAQHGVRVMNVAGPRESKCPGIYDLASGFLEAVLTADGGEGAE